MGDTGAIRDHLFMEYAFFDTLPLILMVVGILLVVGAALGRLSRFMGVPAGLLFLVVGMLLGESGPGRIDFENDTLTYALGTSALGIILFHGGLNTPLDTLRIAWKPSVVLATIGVIGVTFVTAMALWFDPQGRNTLPVCLLIGAILGSTDAAAVFDLLAGQKIKGRAKEIIEVESGLNDPMAFVLVFAFTGMITDGTSLGWGIVWYLFQQLAVGLLVGIISGWVWVRILRIAARSGPGLYPVFTIGAALSSFGIAGVLGGSGLLSAYLAGIFLGNQRIPYRPTVDRVFNTLAWTSQIVMFFILGLLISPSILLANDYDLLIAGVLIALWVAFVSRPLVVGSILLLFRIPWRENLLVCWGGLRGAVPIILATVPVLAISKGDQTQIFETGIDRLFGLVFMAVVVGTIIPGALVRPVTRMLGMRGGTVNTPDVEIDFVTSNDMGHLDRTFIVPQGSVAENTLVRDLDLPDESTMIMILRNKKFIAPQGETMIKAGDHVVMIHRANDTRQVEQLFLSPESRHGHD